MAAKFDAYAKDYETLHANSITASGEQPGYFADYKVDCLARLTGAHFDEPVLDYGCGVGALTHRLCRNYSQIEKFELIFAIDCKFNHERGGQKKQCQ